jgi:hypothetical protein
MLAHSDELGSPNLGLLCQVENLIEALEIAEEAVKRQETPA